MLKRNSLGALLLAGILAGTSFAAMPVVAQAEETTGSTSNSAQLTQLMGQWELTVPSINGSAEITQTFVLAPEGQFFDLSPTNGDIIRFPWWIDYQEQTPVLMVNAGNALLSGILVGPNSMTMRILPLDGAADAEQIHAIALAARKLSTDVTLPTGRTVIDGAEFFRQQAKAATYTQARTSIQSINRAQQAYLLEHQEFASSSQFPQPLLGFDLPDSEYYRFEVQRSGTVAYAIASPTEDGWHSFIGIVAESAGVMGSEQIVCESIEPTRDIPTMTDISGELVCPAGYE